MLLSHVLENQQMAALEKGLGRMAALLEEERLAVAEAEEAARHAPPEAEESDYDRERREAAAAYLRVREELSSPGEELEAAEQDMDASRVAEGRTFLERRAASSSPTAPTTAALLSQDAVAADLRRALRAAPEADGAAEIAAALDAQHALAFALTRARRDGRRRRVARPAGPRRRARAGGARGLPAGAEELARLRALADGVLEAKAALRARRAAAPRRMREPTTRQRAVRRACAAFAANCDVELALGARLLVPIRCDLSLLIVRHAVEAAKDFGYDASDAPLRADVVEAARASPLYEAPTCDETPPEPVSGRDAYAAHWAYKTWADIPEIQHPGEGCDASEIKAELSTTTAASRTGLRSGLTLPRADDICPNWGDPPVLTTEQEVAARQLQMELDECDADKFEGFEEAGKHDFGEGFDDAFCYSRTRRGTPRRRRRSRRSGRTSTGSATPRLLRSRAEAAALAKDHLAYCEKLRDEVVNLMYTGDKDTPPTDLISREDEEKMMAEERKKYDFEWPPNPERWGAELPDDWRPQASLDDRENDVHPEDFKWSTTPFDGRDYCEPTAGPEYDDETTWPGMDKWKAEQAIRDAKEAAWTKEDTERRVKLTVDLAEEISSDISNAHARATATTLNAHWMDGASWRGPYATKGSLVAREFIEDLEGGCPGTHPDFPNKAQSPTGPRSPFLEDIVAGTATLF
ncbi:tRNA-Phe hydroxylase [Aureococcus anophagefferens]|nr:tRNA-Phe hydroxylase [Aureococcus anophagefferens]